MQRLEHVAPLQASLIITYEKVISTPPTQPLLLVIPQQSSPAGGLLLFV